MEKCRLFSDNTYSFVAAGLVAGLGAGFAVGLAREHRRFLFAGKTVLITGGSRGLGLVLAREFLAEGAQVALLARDPDELRRARTTLHADPSRIATIPCDIRQRDEVDKAVAAIAERFGSVDVLVNNAGIIQVGPLDHMTIADFEDAMAIHLFGPLYTTMAVLPHMRRSKAGRIVNITSVGGKIAVPHLLPYTASKFAMVGLSDGLRAELRKENFVTTVCPGLMRTGSPRNALFKGRHRQEYAWFAVSDSMPVLSMDARRAARRIIQACRYGSARAILGVHTKAAVLFNELFPGITAHLLDLANRWLPGVETRAGEQAHPGAESESRWAPSLLTRLSEKAAVANNETPPA
jgi:NAD(P)-dependent dehydrogenase (short-subunit alcohol dehydrogenase family)